jgi:hypothetical protein
MTKITAGASALATLAATAALAAPAGAQSPNTARVGDGQTTLRLAPATGRALAANGVRVGPVAPARAGSSGLTFPVTGGTVNPANLRGSVSHGGGIRFRANGRSVVLREPRYTIRSGLATLSARVGGGRLTVLRLDLSKASVTAPGPLTKSATNIRATLTATAARALNGAFSTRLFKRGLAIGTVSTSIGLRDAVFAGGVTTLAPDAGAAAALASLRITLGTVGAATLGADGIGFPISAPYSRVDAATLAGSINHYGSGLSLSRGDTHVALTDFTIGIDATPALSARLGAQRVEILTLDVSAIQRSVDGNTVVVANVGASLTAAAAHALNAAFGTTAFAPGLKLGTATVRGVTR